MPALIKIGVVVVLTALILLFVAWNEYTQKKIGVETSGTSIKIFGGLGTVFLFIGGAIIELALE
jgi:multisubunit Na+/H+ antiporter MnhB subunit